MSLVSKLLLQQYRAMKSLAGTSAARQRMTTKIIIRRKKIAAARKTIQID